MAVAAIVTATTLLPQTTIIAKAAEGDRTLYLYHTHTRETGRFTFKRNGQYDQGVLRQLNTFLADWRTKEPTKMDPALFDLIWSVYQEVGATQPIHIVSSYRSPKTNAMLASKSSGVADNSLHMKGKAMDFFIPGIDLSTLRATVMRHQVGGIGYYPTSGSPFVHADTGNVRAWPRMTRAQLKKVFPDGRTLHLPTDGKPLSDQGRRYAEAEWKKCKMVPCSGNIFSGGSTGATTMIASLNQEAPIPMMKPRALMGGFVARRATDSGAQVQLASLGGDPQQRVVPTVEIVAPMPLSRGSMRPGGIAENGAPIPAQKSERVLMATLYAPPTGSALEALDALQAEPQPRILMSPGVLTAYAGSQDPEAEQALRMIIEREATASVPKTAIAAAPQAFPPLQTASLGGGDAGLRSMFDKTFGALSKSTPAPMATALADHIAARLPNASIEGRPVDLVAPELDHVYETLVHPVFMAGGHFAVMTEAEGYLDKQTELGPLTGRIGFETAAQDGPVYDHFVLAPPLLVASR